MSNDGVTFEAQGKSLRLRFGINALCDIEQQHDKPVTELFGALQGTPSFRMLRSIFAAGLRDGDPDADFSEADAGEIMGALGIDRAAQLITGAFNAAFPQADDGASGGKAGNARKVTPATTRRG